MLAKRLARDACTELRKEKERKEAASACKEPP